MITDRLRWTVIEANTDNILARDLNVMEPEVQVNLSAPSQCAFKLQPIEQYRSAKGIRFGSGRQMIVCEIEVDGVREVFAYGIIDPEPKVDPASGMMQVETVGVIGYAKGEPWLENFNPIAVDPFEVVQRAWAYLQSFPNANLGVEVTPASSGTQMLPGFGFDGSILSFDFFAIFIRAVDFPDAGDLITSLARDIPFDMVETAQWNANRTELARKIEMSYPYGGIQQNGLSFKHGVNVISAEIAEQDEVQRSSDVIIRSWVPGKIYSSRLSNADTTRYRKTVMEEDVWIDSNERAEVWAHRKLTRRNAPTSFSSIIINPNHPDAPYGKFKVGDSIFVEYEDYPWYGTIKQWHRITGVGYNQDSGQMQLNLVVEGAWTYDPIEYNPDYGSEPTEDPSRLFNGYFGQNLAGWMSLAGSWIRTTSLTYDDTWQSTAGAVRIDCDDGSEYFRSAKCFAVPGETLTLMAAVRWSEVASYPDGAFSLRVYKYQNGELVNSELIDSYIHPTGAHGWVLLQNDWVVPAAIDQIALQFTVEGVTGGVAYWANARVVPAA